MLDMTKVLFLGIGKSSPLWYRCALPAIHLGADWCGIVGEPPSVRVVTGLVKGDTKLPRYEDYEVVVMQQVHGRKWLMKIRQLQSQGIKVIYEIDDYIHGVARQRNHDYSRYYTKQYVKDHELCMRVCDGLICSTEYLARRYAKFNRNVYVCRNGIDLQRFALESPERSTINIGWAGATGHSSALIPWLERVLSVMATNPKTMFVSIGEPGMAQAVGEALSPERAIGIPFTTMECYPAAMRMIDIAIAPAGNTAWYRGKSDLRWLESAALSLPVIADPVVYPDICDGVDGLWAGGPETFQTLLDELVNDNELRTGIGAAAYERVSAERDSETMAMQWSEVLSAVVGEHTSAHELRRS